MSCPDWRSLTLRRELAGGDEPDGWREATQHLDGCANCRQAALAADPTLLFRRLPGLAEPAPPGAPAPLHPAGPTLDWDAEAEAMRNTFAAMRTAGRYTALGSPTPRHRGLGRLAAACLMAALAASTAGGVGEIASTAGSGMREIAGVAGSGVRERDAAALRPAAALVPVRDLQAVRAGQEIAAPAAIEGLSLRGARVYQMSGEHLTSIMVVSEKIDV
jgi:hypothetical protein